MSETITVAAALRRAKRLKGQIAEQTKRAAAGAVYVEGKEPGFGFETSIAQRGKLVKELLQLEEAVARTNAEGRLSNGVSVLLAIRTLAEYKGEIAFYESLLVRAKAKDVEVEESMAYDYTIDKTVPRTKTTTHISAITQGARAAIVDALKMSFETLNSLLEAHNHKTTITIETTDEERKSR